jgi:cytochrome b
LVVLSFATGKAGGSWMEWHLRSGYAVLVLLLFRLAWGFVGSRNARFGAFMRGPAAVWRYLSDWLRGAPPFVSGHNPAGGWMVASLIALLLLQAGTGLFADDDIRTQGPLAVKVSNAWVERSSAVHAFNKWLVVGAVVVHVLAIAAYWVRYRQNLTASLGFGGRSAPTPAATLALAAVLLAAAAGAVYLLVEIYPRG